MKRALKQNSVAALLLYAAYIVYVCPCDRLVSCHKPNFFLSVGVATALVVNDLRG